jgi:hypothetical protein
MVYNDILRRNPDIPQRAGESKEAAKAATRAGHPKHPLLLEQLFQTRPEHRVTRKIAESADDRPVQVRGKQSYA